MAKKKNQTIELIQSGKAELISDRFMVKGSVFDNGIDKPSIMMIVVDLLENKFSIKFFKTSEEAAFLVKALQMV